MNSSLAPVIRSLSFRDDRRAELAELDEDRWRGLLPLCDRARLTLPLAVCAAANLPPQARTRVECNLRDNAERLRRTITTHREISEAFTQSGVDYLVLKGLSHFPRYAASLDQRPQYDIDLYCPPASIETARQALGDIGYTTHGPGRATLDHLPTMIRRTGWRPRGNYFDPQMPLAVELHHRFWDPKTERFSPGSSREFWARRSTSRIGELELPVLESGDRLSYATWHLVRHLLRGDLVAYHVYEIAHFLDSSANDDYWWSVWRDHRDDSLVEAVAFRLAREWFQCRTNPVAVAAINDLPQAAKTWFELFRYSPLEALDRPNKDELFLHLSLISGLRHQASVVKRRLIPLHFSPPTLEAHNPNPPRGLMWKRRLFVVGFAFRRIGRHLRVLPSLLGSVVRWRRASGLQSIRRGRRKSRPDSVRA